jgi:carbamate kinase
VVTRAAVATDFVTRTGGIAVIGPIDNALGILLGTTGTLIRPAPAPVGGMESSAD